MWINGNLIFGISGLGTHVEDICTSFYILPFPSVKIYIYPKLYHVRP